VLFGRSRLIFSLLALGGLRTGLIFETCRKASSKSISSFKPPLGLVAFGFNGLILPKAMAGSTADISILKSCQIGFQ